MDRKLIGALVLGLAAWFGPAGPARGGVVPGVEEVVIVELEGRVEVSRGGAPFWDPAYTNQVLRAGDRLRTGPRSRAVLRVPDQTTFRVGKETVLLVPGESRRGGLNLLRGLLYFFHRDKPRQFPVRTPTAYAVVLGTEFNIAVAGDGATTIHMVDGQVEMTNELGQLTLYTGQAGRAGPNQPPTETAVVDAANVIQWCLYYPGVLDLEELSLAAGEAQRLQESLHAYRQGDLLAALAAHPPEPEPASAQSKIYLAALLLSVGEVEEAEAILAAVPRDGPGERLVRALQTVIAAVRPGSGEVSDLLVPGKDESPSATLWLAMSYFHQSHARLREALGAAREAVRISPAFAFAQARLGEMEFSFGRIAAARSAAEASLQHAGRNAQAWALTGFLQAGENRVREAVESFDRALAIDGALGNAWLGRGLCRFRLGDVAGGLEDLQVAATVEPQRALLRSYLGKAFARANDPTHALEELDLAQRLDNRDPTAWFYRALILYQQNRVNEAIRQLERSQALNDNRRIYRSRLLLDQDQAVRSVNQALLYADAGMAEVSLREAGRAVEADYANYAAHLLLANSYQALRDPKGISQRFESAAVDEYLLANLLAPANANTLAQSVSQQEYSRLFDSDGLGLASLTEYLSRGDWLQAGAQYGNLGGFGYALSGYYRSDNGQRPNNEFEQMELSLQLKQELTAKDSIYLQAIRGEAEGGDLLQRYDPASAIGGLHFQETQQPILLAGYHRAWGPGSHTLFLGGWLNSDFRLHNPEQDTFLLQPDIPPEPLTIDQRYRNELEIYTAELQQLWQSEQHGLTVGGRYQAGEFDALSQHRNPTFRNTGDVIPDFLFRNGGQTVEAGFERISLYGYYRWQVVPSLQLIAGLAYDRLTFPANFRFAPLLDGEDRNDQVSPKAGLIWKPADNTTIRAAYARSLGGVSFDQSFRLEPTQVAGFNQTFRSLIPESLAGANANARFDRAGLSVEQKFNTGTYLGLSAEWLDSRVDRLFGVYEFNPLSFSVDPTVTPERLDFQERSLTFTCNQLIGEEWALGGLYRLSEARLHDRFPAIADSPSFPAQSRTESVLHQLKLFAVYNHRSGLFAQAESLWHTQSNQGYSSDRPGDDFWQFNAYAGYRFPRRQAEIRVGLLNITDQDYRLNPLNLTPELPRDRTFLASFRFHF